MSRLPEHTSIRRVLRVLGLSLLAAIVLRAVLLFGSRIAYELSGPLTADTPLYWAVGRGILHGLLPYSDLFETKPPGIFLLSAISVALTGSESLMYVLQAIAIIVLPVLLILHVRREAATRCRHRPWLLLVAALFGILLALYTAERSGEVQVESFGAAATGAYLYLAASTKRLERARLWIAGCALLAAVGLKEPFLLTAIGGAVLLHRHHPAVLVNRLLAPLVIAAGLGLAALLSLGYAEGYFAVYLPEMLFLHIGGAGPLSQRALYIGRLWSDLRAFSPLLSVSLTLTLTGLLIAALLRRSRISATIALGLAVLLASTAVSIGGQYYNHHFVFAVPVYMAAVMAFLAACATFRVRIPALVGAYGLAAVLLLAIAQLPQPAYAERIEGLRADREVAERSAAYIDATLSACGRSRYLFLGGNGIRPYGFTKHPPLGPIFFQYHYLLSRDRDAFRESFLRSVGSADVVVWDNPELNELKNVVEHYLDRWFSEEPWPCAGPPPTGPYRYLFRYGP
jgi:hypothetical protein